jgi:DNA-binding SARP family transcriptional activator/predicted ATPase
MYARYSVSRTKLQINLLGTPQINWGNERLTLQRRQVRGLLFYLAAQKIPASRDVLLVLFWPDSTETTARRNLSRLLSTLRHDLPHPNIISATRTTLALNKDLTQSDVITFDNLIAGNDVARWKQAVDLCRDPFLNGFSLSNSREFDRWQSQQQYVYERRLLSTLTKLVITLRQQRRTTEAIEYAHRYLVTDDLSEEMHRHLIELYAGSGDFAAAARQFEQCVMVLEQELGVEPLPATRAAYEAIRGRGVVAPAIQPKPVLHTLPTLNLPLIGREHALVQLTAAYERLQSGGVVFISGEAGIGKSRLMQEFANQQTSSLFLTGSSPRWGQSFPYQPLIEALRMALSFQMRWQHVLPTWLAELTRLLPELRRQHHNLPQPIDIEPQQSQARLFEALLQVFRSLAIESPLVLCLDDVHRADATTHLWLQYVNRHLGGSNICILATYRTHQQTVLREWHRELRRVGLMAIVQLEGLTMSAVAELVCQLETSVSVSDALAARIHAATGGNAFFTLETIRKLIEMDQLADPPANLPLPPTVRDVILQRAGRLTPLTYQVLEIAAVLSPDLSLSVIGHAAGRNEMDIADSLEELVARQLILVDSEQFRFLHDLAREAIYRNISDWRRRLLHKRVAKALVALPNQGDIGFAATVAIHFDKAGIRPQAIDYYLQAATQSRRVYADNAAIEQYEQALTLSEDAISGEQLKLRVRLHKGLGQVLRRQALYKRAAQAYEGMRLTAEKLNDSEMVAQAWLGLGGVQDSLRQYSDSLHSATSAALLTSKNQPNVPHAFALYAQSWALFRLGKLNEAMPIAEKALEESTKMNHTDVMARSHNTLGAIHKYLGQYQLSEQHQELALKLFQETGDTRRVAGMFNNLGETARLRQDYSKAYDFYRQAITIAEKIGERDWLVEFFGPELMQTFTFICLKFTWFRLDGQTH